MHNTRLQMVLIKKNRDAITDTDAHSSLKTIPDITNINV